MVIAFLSADALVIQRNTFPHALALNSHKPLADIERLEMYLYDFMYAYTKSESMCFLRCDSITELS